MHAQTRNVDAFVFVGDRDQRTDKEKDIANAQTNITRLGLPKCAAATPVETFDAWVLYDIVSLSNVLTSPQNQPSSPHTMNGKQNSGNHPKDYCRNLILQSKCQLTLTQFYNQVFQLVDIETLIANIPNNKFRDFCDQLRKF